MQANGLSSYGPYAGLKRRCAQCTVRISDAVNRTGGRCGAGTEVVQVVTYRLLSRRRHAGV